MEPATETQKSFVKIIKELDMTPPPAGWEENKIITDTYIDEQFAAMEVDENKTAAKQPASEKRRDKPDPSLMRKFCLRGGDVPL